MIPRYTPAAFANIWSERTKYLTWLEVELAACVRRNKVRKAVAVQVNNRAAERRPHAPCHRASAQIESNRPQSVIRSSRRPAPHAMLPRRAGKPGK